MTGSWNYVIMHSTLEFFPCHKALRTALISVSLALSQTPVYTARPQKCD